MFSTNLPNPATEPEKLKETLSDIRALEDFGRAYMAAYNQPDFPALRKMYNEYAFRTDMHGQKMTGGNQIVTHLEQELGSRYFSILRLRASSITKAKGQSGYVVRGTYEIIGKQIVYDIDLHTTGTYTNKMMKYDGRWQIAKSVLTPLVKTLVHYGVEDFHKWKSGFEAGEATRVEAGEISSEIGHLQDDPNTVYVLSEWTSLEAFQTFSANPDLEKIMQQAGVIGKPTILILDQK
jgi:quinol monooxygenase YgiN/ketosteroid isomerase-like protein